MSPARKLAVGGALAAAVVLGGVVISQTASDQVDPKDAHIQTAISELDAALALPVMTVTLPAETITQVVTTTVAETGTTTTASTTTASPSGCTGVKVSPGAGLKAAVDAAPAGSTFCLAAGTYTISATITLQDGDELDGAGVGQTFIVGNGTVQNMFGGASGGTFEVRDLDVSGAVGDANATCSPDCGRAFMGTGERWTFDGIRCHGNANQCIGTGTADVYFLNSECDHNGNAAFASAAARSTACIKRVRGASSNIVTVVRGSDFHDNFWSAIWFDFYEGAATISGNTFTGNGKSGVQVEVTGGFNAADGVSIHDNTFHGNGSFSTPIRSAIICANCADTTIEDNTFGGNSTAAVAFVKTAREWGGYVDVLIRNNALNGDALNCPSGVTCSGNGG